MWTFGALWLSGCVVGGGEQAWSFQGATSLWVSMADGDVDVRPSPDAITTVSYDGGGFGKAARPDVYQQGDGGVVVEADGGLGGGDLVVDVVGGIPVTVLLDRGDISIELAAPADIDACVGAGSVSIGVPAGAYALDLEGGAGDIDADITDDPGAPFTIHACFGAGDIDVHLYDPYAWSSSE